ncbi:hypothetical protein E2C01_015935 [Portunus trituberculatus]|uniref:Uncharacterized protein n=1 Tax=Portunus trituberculatus TaxID=210409 RepID=A0A5B7DPQ3_PORTR|nr:hypothetical protein [Portunus trituberculatus]
MMTQGIEQGRSVTLELNDLVKLSKKNIVGVTDMWCRGEEKASQGQHNAKEKAHMSAASLKDEYRVSQI